MDEIVALRSPCCWRPSRQLIASTDLIHPGVCCMGKNLGGAVNYRRSLFLFDCAMLAGWLPAQRAASVDPMQVIPLPSIGLPGGGAVGGEFAEPAGLPLRQLASAAASGLH